MTQKNDAAEELGVLHPEQTITLAGDQVTVREFTFLDGLKAGAIASEMIEDLGMAIDADAAEVDYHTVERVFAQHATVLTKLLSMATDRPASWVIGLNDEDGRKLTMTFWVVNSGFFVRRLVTDIQLRREAARAEQLDMQNSTQH